jgi:hypothetical protein
MNVFSIRVDEKGGPGDIRFFIVIDGQERFQIGEECLDDSFMSRALSNDSEVSTYRRGDQERVIDFGFCTEGCCPSKFADITYAGDRVIWSCIRISTSDAPVDATKFEFPREDYEQEINRVQLWLARYYQDHYSGPNRMGAGR